MATWSEFSFDLPKDPRRGWEHADCVEFEYAYHVTHIEIALRIMRDEKIRRSLIGDKSILKAKRIAVTWISPNTWKAGSMYGNVGFAYKFPKRVEGKNIYWVEVMREYTPMAVRILITDNEYPYLKRYNPKKDDGPWKITEDGRHYRLRSVNLEFMLEEDLYLNLCRYVQTFDHHHKYCSVYKDKCKDLDKKGRKAAKEYFSAIVAQGVPIKLRHHRELIKDSMVARASLSQAISGFFGSAGSRSFEGKSPLSSEASESLVRASLNAIAVGNTKDYKALLSLFNSKKEYESALEKIIIKYFELDTIDD